MKTGKRKISIFSSFIMFLISIIAAIGVDFYNHGKDYFGSKSFYTEISVQAAVLLAMVAVYHVVSLFLNKIQK